MLNNVEVLDASSFVWFSLQGMHLVCLLSWGTHTLVHYIKDTVKLSTNYSIQADVSYVGYCPCDESLNITTTDDERIEISGVEWIDVILFARNLIVADIVKFTPKVELPSHQLKLLGEIKDSLTEYLKEEEEWPSFSFPSQHWLPLQSLYTFSTANNHGRTSSV